MSNLSTIGNKVKDYLLFAHLPVAFINRRKPWFSQFLAASIISVGVSFCIDAANKLTSDKITKYYQIKSHSSRSHNSRNLEFFSRLISPAGFAYFNYLSKDLTVLDKNLIETGQDPVYVWGDDVIKFEKGKGFSYDYEEIKDKKFMIGLDESYPEVYSYGKLEKVITKNNHNIEELNKEAKQLYGLGNINEAMKKEKEARDIFEESIEYKTKFSEKKDYLMETLNIVVQKLNGEYRKGLSGQDE